MTEWLLDDLRVVPVSFPDDASRAAPPPAKGHHFNSRSPGGPRGQGAPACPQPAALHPVFTATDQRLTCSNLQGSIKFNYLLKVQKEFFFFF